MYFFQDQLEKAVVYLIKAISMAKENPRYVTLYSIYS